MNKIFTKLNHRLSPYQLLMTLLFALYVGEGLILLFFGNIIPDAGWFLYASKLVYQGKIPYRDFIYFQAPLLPYIYGMPQHLFGKGILIGRVTSFALSFATLFFSLRLARRLGGKVAALFTIAATCSSFLVLWTYTITRTESLTTPLGMISLYFLIAYPHNDPFAALMAVSAMLWASATRISYLPSFLLTLAIVLYRNRSHMRKVYFILAVCGVQASIFFGFPLAIAPDNVVFNILSSQISRGQQLNQSAILQGAPLYIRGINLIVSKLSAILNHNDELEYSLVAFVTCMLFAGVMYITGTDKAGGRDARNLHLKQYLFMGVLGLTIYAPNLLPPGTIPHYFVPTFAIIAVLIGGLLSNIYYLSPEPRTRLLILSLLVTVVLFQFISSFSHYSRYLSFRSPQLIQLEEVSTYLDSILPPDEPIFTFNTYIAVEAEREIMPGLEMNTYSFFPLFSTKESEKYGVVNEELVQKYLQSCRASAVLLTDFEIRLFVDRERGSPHLDKPLTEEQIYSSFPGLRKCYQLARVFPNFGPDRDHLYILPRIRG